jgi:Xaa-Pro aminopeptidase
MDSFFTSEFFAQNRLRLRKTVDGNSTIIIPANGQMQRAADEPFSFTQDSNFWYLTGLNTPDLVLVMTARDCYLIAPLLSHEREVFDGSHDLSYFSERSGITEIVGETEGWERIRSEVLRSHRVAVCQPLPTYLDRYRMFSLPYRRRLLEKLKRIHRAIEFDDIRPTLARMRSLKQAPELAAMQRAIDITLATLDDATNKDLFVDAQKEFELEAAISYGFRRRGATGHAFQPIVGAGVHTTTLHHIDNNGEITPGDLIVLDIGANVEHYAADITRTVSQLPFTSRQQAVYDAVASVQDYALGLLKPGILLAEYEHKVALFLGNHLKELGLVQSADSNDVRRYFPHATSHFLGLDTHDVGEYDKPLQEGMVLTCEPGIYIPEERIGVRIEDDVLLTPGGNKVLSKSSLDG